MRVADYVIDYIFNHGTDTIFTLAGGGAMFLNDAVVLNKKMNYVCCHHEQACAMAAEAYAKTKNRVGAVMVTSGPGSTNAITGLLEAWQNSIPVIFISSQAKKSQMTKFEKPEGLRQIGIQEVNIIPIVKPLTKYAVSVSDSNDIENVMEKSYEAALKGRPGPVWIDIPSDIAATQINLKKSVKDSHCNWNINKKPTDSDINKVINQLKKSKKPVIIAGGGIRIAGAVKEFIEFIKLFKIPVVVPEMGIDLLEYKNPLYMGHGGTKGQRNANMIMQNSDFILSLGSRLAVSFIGHEYDKFAPAATKFIVDIDPTEHQKKTIKIDHLIESDVKEFMKVLIEKTKKEKFNYEKWVNNCQKIKNKYSSIYPVADNNKSISMYDAVSVISSYSRQGDIFTFDAGITAYICSQTIKIKRGQRTIIPGATLTMGYNLPAIIGIWAATKKNRIICITGDGSFQTNIHELATIVHHKIPSKIFIINNSGYLAIRTTQRNFFQGRLIGEGKKSGVTIPSAQAIAKAYGIVYIKANQKKNLKSIISKAISYKDTIICEIFTPYWQDIITVSSKKLANGKMISLPIDDMAPFLPENELKNVRSMLA